MEKEQFIALIMGTEKLILLKRINPVEYEIHLGEISRSKNLLLSTKDESLAQTLVDTYNNKNNF